MKTTIATLATAANLLAAMFNPTHAKGTDAALSQSDWNAITEQTEIENATEIDEIPALLFELTDADWKGIEISSELEKAVYLILDEEVDQSALDIHLKAGKNTSLLLDAPFNDSDIIGVAVIDASGNVISSSVGTFAELKNVQITEKRNETYVVRVYSESKVFETKVQVVFM